MHHAPFAQLQLLSTGLTAGMAVSLVSMASSLGHPLIFGWRHAGFAVLRSHAGRSAINYSQHSGFSTTPLSRTTSDNQSSSACQDFDYEAIKFDRAFLDFVRKRLLDPHDTSAYFKHCKEEPVRQAGVFMVTIEVFQYSGSDPWSIWIRSN